MAAGFSNSKLEAYINEKSKHKHMSKAKLVIFLKVLISVKLHGWNKYTKYSCLYDWCLCEASFYLLIVEQECYHIFLSDSKFTELLRGIAFCLCKYSYMMYWVHSMLSTEPGTVGSVQSMGNRLLLFALNHGIPHFDRYKRRDKISYNKFCKSNACTCIYTGGNSRKSLVPKSILTTYTGHFQFHLNNILLRIYSCLQYIRSENAAHD